MFALYLLHNAKFWFWKKILLKTSLASGMGFYKFCKGGGWEVITLSLPLSYECFKNILLNVNIFTIKQVWWPLTWFCLIFSSKDRLNSTFFFVPFLEKQLRSFIIQNNVKNLQFPYTDAQSYLPTLFSTREIDQN